MADARDVWAQQRRTDRLLGVDAAEHSAHGCRYIISPSHCLQVGILLHA